MKVREKILSVAALLMALIAPAMAWAQGGPPPVMPPGPLPPPFMLGLKQANLTSDQQTQLNSILQSGAAQAKPLLDQLHSINSQISAKLLQAETPSAADFTSLVQQAAQLQQQLQQQSVALALQVRSILTAEQLAQMAQLSQQMESLHSQMDALINGPAPSADSTH